MQIKLYRSSGYPVNNPKEYLLQLNLEMDKLKDEKDMLKVQDILTKWHDTFIETNPIQITVELDIENLCTNYGSVAFCYENEVLVAYILDK